MVEKINELAQQIRQQWVIEHRNFELRTTGIASGWGARHMVKWDGGTSNDGRQHKPIWPKIAELCVANELDPVLLVRSLFHNKLDRPPLPNQASGNYALELYRSYTSPSTLLEMKNELINSFETQKQKAAATVFSRKNYSKLDEKTAWQTVIVSKDVALTPLFRYCVAANQGWTDIAEANVKLASAQYRRNAKLYDEIWGDWITSDFKTIALAQNKGS